MASTPTPSHTASPDAGDSAIRTSGDGKYSPSKPLDFEQYQYEQTFPFCPCCSTDWRSSPHDDRDGDVQASTNARVSQEGIGQAAEALERVLLWPGEHNR
ncbi:hypothetical protein AC579_8174 [Pseudocercospora musae]|uniref:Uncharacterized protein n=1 Tax=Pseudocercospora musae TaxID=113226 RepID=A0A139IUX6_9PEZI|nr:hypothetical protein AC579_8174 [Pseudocercospora musae]